jgi:hypothetical protein
MHRERGAMDRVKDDQYAHDLLKLWVEELRPLLKEHVPGEIGAVDQSAELLAAALRRKTQLQVGFIGESQVGKSSLINALVERSALPSGGIGPLTAQATQVAYADDDCLTVSYHDIEKLRGVRLLLESALVRRGELAPLNSDGRDEATLDELELDLGAVAPAPLPADEPPNDDAVQASAAAAERFNYLLEQLWSMLGPDLGHDADARPPGSVLVDGLRAILNERPRNPEAVTAFLPRIEQLQNYLGQTETVTSSDALEFMQTLKVRAAGWLAPLVKTLRVGLRCEIVRSLSLVDLPGIGVRADPGAFVAEDFVREGGDALVVVMRNSGLTESIARLLERTGVVTRLLMEGEGPPSIRVMVVVTHLDDVAKTRWREASTSARARGQRPPDAGAVFAELAAEMSAKARSDIRGALLTAPAAAELTDERRARREQRIEALCAEMEVLCVSAPDYLWLIDGFEDEAWLKHREATNVPAFRGALEGLAAKHAKQRQQDIAQAANALWAIVDGYLRATAQAYEEGRGAATEQWESFRAALQDAMQGLRDQMNASHGELLARLKEAIPADIRLLCAEAEKGTAKRVKRLRTEGEKLYFKSLEAALKHDAVWDRKAINYPVVLTEKFIEPIASDWDTRIVGGVRNAIKQMVDRDVRLVEKLCDAAKALDERVAGEDQITSQKQLMEQRAKTCVAFTKEKLAELTGRVSAELSKKIGQVMNATCKRALAAGHNQGKGAKQRILDAFENGGTLASEKAREHAEGLLLAYYDALRRELEQDYLAEQHDPLTDAFRRLTDDERSRAARRDARKAAAVRAQVAHALELLAPFQSADATAAEVSS